MISEERKPCYFLLILSQTIKVCKIKEKKSRLSALFKLPESQY